MFYGLTSQNSEAFSRALETMQSIYPDMFAGDMLIAFWRNRTFLSDENFMRSYQDNARNDQERSLIWRLHTLTWAAESTAHLAGDFVECGTFKGACASMICQYMNFAELDKKFYLYDTFEGLHDDYSTAEERQAWHVYSDYNGDELYKEVRSRFEKYPNVEVIRGVVPESFEQACPEKIAFMHIDMNAEKAEIAALDALFDKMVPGGILVLDDFGWEFSRNQAIAELRFMKERGLPILELPTGQGVVIKTF